MTYLFQIHAHILTGTRRLNSLKAELLSCGLGQRIDGEGISISVTNLSVSSVDIASSFFLSFAFRSASRLSVSPGAFWRRVLICIWNVCLQLDYYFVCPSFFDLLQSFFVWLLLLLDHGLKRPRWHVATIHMLVKSKLIPSEEGEMIGSRHFIIKSYDFKRNACIYICGITSRIALSRNSWK